MTEPGMHLPEGQLPLQPIAFRPGSWREANSLNLPELNVVLGRDRHSSGLTIAVWESTEGQYPKRRTLYAARWLEPVLTTEGALRMASHGLAAAVAELFGPELPS